MPKASVPLAVGLRELQSTGLLCDAVVVAGQERFKVHQAVLAAASPALRQHILAIAAASPSRNPTRPLGKQPQLVELNLEDLTEPSITGRFLDMFYGRDLQQGPAPAEVVEEVAALQDLAGALGLAGGQGSGGPCDLDVKAATSAISKGLLELRSSGDLCDLSLRCCGSTFLAHQAVLAGASTPFKEIVSTQIGELLQGDTPALVSQGFELELDGVEYAEAVNVFLNHVYGRTIQAADFETMPIAALGDVVWLALGFGLSELQVVTESWLLERATAGNVNSCLDVCHRLGHGELRERIKAKLAAQSGQRSLSPLPSSPAEPVLPLSGGKEAESPPAKKPRSRRTLTVNTSGQAAPIIIPEDGPAPGDVFQLLLRTNEGEATSSSTPTHGGRRQILQRLLDRARGRDEELSQRNSSDQRSPRASVGGAGALSPISDRQMESARPSKGETLLEASLRAMQCVKISEEEVPDLPVCDEKELRTRRETRLAEKLHMLFFERPVWLQAPLEKEMGTACDSETLMKLLPYVAYQWSDGPWFPAYAKLGFDPRKHCEDAKWLQVISFRDPFFRSLKRSQSLPSNEASDPFFRHPPSQRTQNYQLTDIRDDFIIGMIDGAETLEECSRKTGWLPQVVCDAVKERLTIKSQQQRERLANAQQREAAKKGGGRGRHSAAKRGRRSSKA